MPEPHEQLDDAMNGRRIQLHMKWRDVAAGAGISYEALRAIRRGESKPAELTARAIDEALRWVPGGVRLAMAGGQPTPLEAQDERPVTPSLTPDEALRRLVRASARELGVTPEGIDAVMRLVRQDLEAGESPKPRRTDLSDLLRLGRAEAGLSLEAVAAATVDASSGQRLVEADWLDRLERAALDPSEYPEYPQLDALVDVLTLDPARVQDAAGAQFADVHTLWSKDGQVRGLVAGELSAEDTAKMDELMRLYRKAPRRP